MMTRRSSLLALAGLVSGMLVTGDFSLPRQVFAQHTHRRFSRKPSKVARKLLRSGIP
jgi:hypothetical protein